jgi:hypothetical protein
VLSVRIGDHYYYGLCDIGASTSVIPYELMVRCWPPSWEPQEEGMMSTAAIFPQYETKVYRTSRRKNQLPKVDAIWLGDSSRQFICGALSGA